MAAKQQARYAIAQLKVLRQVLDLMGHRYGKSSHLRQALDASQRALDAMESVTSELNEDGAGGGREGGPSQAEESVAVEYEPDDSAEPKMIGVPVEWPKRANRSGDSESA